MSRPTTLAVIDGNNLANRALYGFPADMATSGGQLTGAVKGLLGMLKEIRFRHRVTHWVIAWDTYRGSWRKAIYPEYKANRVRDPSAPSIGDQWDLIHEMVDILAIPNVRVDASEADDIIAAVVEKFHTSVSRTVIESNDKDLMQLVRPGVYQALADKTLADVNTVTLRQLVPPAMLGDKLAIAGDKIDNVPGVAGVGDVVAAKWLLEYGSIEGIRKAIFNGALKGKRAAAFAQCFDDGLLTTFRTLVSLDTSVVSMLPYDDLDSLRVRQPDYDALMAFYERLEFKQEIDDLLDLPAYQRHAARSA